MYMSVYVGSKAAGHVFSYNRMCSLTIECVLFTIYVGSKAAGHVGQRLQCRQVASACGQDATGLCDIVCMMM